MYQLKKIFLFSFLYCFSNVFQAEESEQIDDIKDYDLFLPIDSKSKI